jgi:hypothetical protein
MDQGPDLRTPEMSVKAEVGTMREVKKGVETLLDMVVHKGVKVGEVSFVAETRGAERGFRVVVFETIVDQVV